MDGRGRHWLFLCVGERGEVILSFVAGENGEVIALGEIDDLVVGDNLQFPGFGSNRVTFENAANERNLGIGHVSTPHPRKEYLLKDEYV